MVRTKYSYRPILFTKASHRISHVGDPSDDHYGHHRGFRVRRFGPFVHWPQATKLRRSGRTSSVSAPLRLLPDVLEPIRLANEAEMEKPPGDEPSGFRLLRGCQDEEDNKRVSIYAGTVSEVRPWSPIIRSFLCSNSRQVRCHILLAG